MYSEVVKYLIGLSSISLGIYWTIRYFHLLKKSRLSETWHQTEGKIIVSELVSDFGEVENHAYSIKYEFVASGKKYVSDKVVYGTLDFQDTNYLKRYPLGKTVTVYYDPYDPFDSILEKGTRDGLHFILVFVFFLLFLGTCVVSCELE